MKQKILKLLDERDALLDEYHKKANPDRYCPTPKADAIEDKIVKMLKKDFDKFDCDFVLETLTRFGCAPSLIYDDNGHWAVSAEGTQPVVYGKKRLTGHIGMSFMFKRADWLDTIREAVKHFLNRK